MTPLPPLAQRIIRSIPRRDGEPDLVFPGRARGRPLSPSGPLVDKVVACGGPAGFEFHAWRHTVASWLKNQGHDVFDRGLVLNHSESGVTAGYSHGYALERKRELLEKWADHVERLVAAEGGPPAVTGSSAQLRSSDQRRQQGDANTFAKSAIARS